MFKIFFGDIKTGQVRRLAFFGYSLLIQILAFGFVLSVVFAMGIGEYLLDGDLLKAEELIRASWLMLSFIVVFGIVIVLAAFAGINLTAKRIRDIGLPGWSTLLIFFILQMITSIFISEQISSGLHLILTIALLLIPTGLLNIKSY